MRLGEKLFRLVLLAYPRRLRRRKGAEMWSTFDGHLRDAEGTARWGVLWVREVRAAIVGGIRARFAERRRVPPKTSRRSRQFPPRGSR